jgi:uncharacterized HAD superfamily protein
MRIAIDIDSTLHHYWDVLSEVSRRRFGIELPYEEQLTWGMTRLRPDQFALCVKESHSDERILAATPYPGAVEAVTRWHEEGHFVHVTSQRDCDRKEATARWLRRIGLPYDDLHCSQDKLARCKELAVGLLIDDGPMNLEAALEGGIAAATLLHPWNRDFCEVENVLGAQNWPELERLLEPLLAAAPLRRTPRQGTEVGAAK